MKREIPVSMARRLINAGNIVLVTSAYKEKKNILTLAWSTPLSHNQAHIGISVAKGHYSWELIHKSGEFHLNIPDHLSYNYNRGSTTVEHSSIFKKALFCGRNSGRNVDKFKQTGLTPEKPEKIKAAPGIAECIGQAECRVVDEIDAGDHTFFIGQVLYAQAEGDLFHEVWDVSKARLIHHLGGDIFAVSSELLKVE